MNFANEQMMIMKFQPSSNNQFSKLQTHKVGSGNGTWKLEFICYGFVKRVLEYGRRAHYRIGACNLEFYFLFDHIV